MIAEALQGLAVPITDLKPLEGNPRRGDVKAVAKSLKRFGQRKPIVVDADGTVLAGNHTLAAAIELGWTEIAVVRSDDDEATGRAYALADNNTSARGGFDREALQSMIGEVHAVDPELLEATSFTEKDLVRPEPPDNNNDLGPRRYAIVLECVDEAHQAQLLDQLGAEGLKCRALLG